MITTSSPFNKLQAHPERTSSAHSVDAPQPLVDRLVLERLQEELADDGEVYTRVFIAHFIACLPERIGRLRLALTTGDWEGSFDAVLSLRTSSQMVGAGQLASLAMKLEAELRDATLADTATALPQQAATYLGPITRCGSKTILKLTSRYPAASRTRL